MRRRDFILCCAAAGFAHGQEPGAGKILVASPKTGDPDFEHTVVLLVHNGREGAVGFMINRPIDVPLSEAFRDIDPRHDRKGFVFLGGPVAMGVNALIRAQAAPESAAKVSADVYLMADRAAMEKLVISAKPSTMHVYVGTCGWAPRQLQAELVHGLWRVINGSADLVFDVKPSTLWTRLTSAQA